MQSIAHPAGQSLISRAAKLLVAATLTLTAATVFADEIAEVQKLLSAGKNPEALQKADQYLTGKPKDPMMRFLKGISLSQAGRTTDAIAVFVKLTEDYPELPEPFNNLAVLYAQQGQYEKSRTALEMAIRTNPSYATAYENLGDVYAKLASQAYSKALQIDTKSGVAPKLAMIKELFPRERNALLASASGATSYQAPAPTPRAVAPAPAPMPAPVQPSVAPTPPAAPVRPQPPAVAPAPKPTPAPAASTQIASHNAPLPEAKPASRPEPKVEVSSGKEREVESTIHGWVAAWSKKDLNGYFSYYGREFNPGKSRKAWEDERRSRILGKRNISIKISGLKVTVSGNKATATFRQEYRADGLSIGGSKKLELVRSGNTWLIVKETASS
ncbi:MAG TPA: tetratricopeptide repeat protein [Aquabacterium sp.]|nr:tetratricopeptide repeat protein [Aquabacterium sp.]